MKLSFERPLAAALFAAALIACGSASAESPTISTDQALELISVERLERHVRFLGSDALLGRDAAEPGYGIAAQYVAQRMSSMGVEAGGNEVGEHLRFVGRGTEGCYNFSSSHTLSP